MNGNKKRQKKQKGYKFTTLGHNYEWSVANVNAELSSRFYESVENAGRR